MHACITCLHEDWREWLKRTKREITGSTFHMHAVYSLRVKTTVVTTAEHRKKSVVLINAVFAVSGEVTVKTPDVAKRF